MAVGLEPQLVLHGLRQVAPEQGVEVFEQRFSAPDHKGERCQHAELAGHRRDAKGRQPGGVLLHHHIHRQTDQHRWRQIKQLVEHRAAGREPHQAAMGAQAAQQALQRRSGPGMAVFKAWRQRRQGNCEAVSAEHCGARRPR